MELARRCLLLSWPLERIILARIRFKPFLLVPTRELALPNCLRRVNNSVNTWNVQVMVSTGGTAWRMTFTLCTTLSMCGHSGACSWPCQQGVANLSECSIAVDRGWQALESRVPTSNWGVDQAPPGQPTNPFILCHVPVYVKAFKDRFLNKPYESIWWKNWPSKGITQYYAYVEAKTALPQTLFSKLQINQSIIFVIRLVVSKLLGPRRSPNLFTHYSTSTPRCRKRTKPRLPRISATACVVI